MNRRKLCFRLAGLLLFLMMVLLMAVPAMASSSISFQAAVYYGTANYPSGVAVADLNADGKPDLAIACRQNSKVSVLLGNGDGTFQTKVDYSVGTSPCHVVVGDFNADGKLDLATANDGASVSILSGNGDGTFQAAVNTAMGVHPQYLAVGDFNADGNPDLAVADYNSSSSKVYVLLGSGGGTFQAPVAYTAGSSIRSVAAGDFNADGKADLVAANLGSNSVSILPGNGDGSFGAAVNYSTKASGKNATFPEIVNVGDLNADGKLDLAVADYGGDAKYISVLLGVGDGTFNPVANYVAGSKPYGLAIGEFNCDGKPDLAVTGDVGSGNVVYILPGNGDGSFGAVVNYTTGANPRSVAVGDLNADGKPDLAVPNYFSNNVSIMLNNTVIPVTGVTLDKHADSIAVGATDQLTATVIPPCATDKSVTWSSSDTSVATVDSNGLVTAVAEGSATITVTTTDGGYSDTCEVTVTAATVLVTGVTLDKHTDEICVGSSDQLTATVSPDNANDKSVTWSSSDTSVATVDSSGKVSGASTGTATITVTTNDGGYADTCEVTVQSCIPEPPGVESSPVPSAEPSYFERWI